MTNTPSPVAPEFVGYREGQPVRVRFDQERSAVLTSEEAGRPAASLPWTDVSEPLRIAGDQFVCRWSPDVAPLRLEVRDDDYGMALAFVEFVNRRRPTGADPLGEPIRGAPRFQYAVVETAPDLGPVGLAEILGRAGSRGWEVVEVHGASSNWFGGPDRGFLLLKRMIPDGMEIAEWCVTLRA